MRRRVVIALVVLGIAGAATGGTLLALSSTGSSERAVIHRVSRLIGKLPVPKHVRFKTRVSLPDLTARALKRLERGGLNETLSPTAVRAAEPLLRSSAFPQTRVLPAKTPERLRLLRQTLVDKGHALFIAEPDVATNGNRVMVTWNDGAGFSRDSGRHFTFVDPKDERIFPPAHGGFCCDQVALYAPGEDLWIWLLQYWQDGTGNILRLAVGRGDASFDTHNFQVLDLAPSSYGWSHSAFFDYPDAALTKQNLFVSVNAFDDGAYAGTLVLRVPLADLAFPSPTLRNARYLTTRSRTAVLTAGASDTMYVLSHAGTAALRLWSWSDGSAAPDPPAGILVHHTRYPFSGFIPFRCRRTGGPPASDWCERLLDSGPTNDDRPTTAWVANGVIGVAWNAQQAPARGFPYPFVMVVRIDEHTKKVIDEPFIWNRHYAFEFLDAAPNGQGDLGGLVLAGGGSSYEGCAAVGRASGSRAKSPWEARLADRSNRDPSEAKAGDYLGVSPATVGARTWVGACNTLRGGRGPENVGIRFFAFGRR